MLERQIQAETRSAKAQAKDTKLMGQQMGLQTELARQNQMYQQQAISTQTDLLGNYEGGLQQQLEILRQQNSLLQQQGQEQTSYYQAQRAFMDEQRQIQLSQQKRADDEAQYTSLLEQKTASQSALKANSMRQQLNRRRTLMRMGSMRTE